MERAVKFTIIFIFLISFISAGDYECKKAYYFIIENQYFNNESIDNFNIKNELNIPYEYFNEFEDNCKNYSLPFNEKNIGKLEKIENITYCETKINENVLFYNLDWRIPIFTIDIEKRTCDSVNNLKWFFELKQVGNNYQIKGIKIWYITILFFITFMILFYRSLKKTNEAMDSLNLTKK